MTFQESPWTMLKKDHHLYTGNERYEGFVLDMMDEISAMLKFTYELYEVPDGNFGSELPNGEWNGMMGQVMSGVGDNYCLRNYNLSA